MHIHERERERVEIAFAFVWVKSLYYQADPLSTCHFMRRHSVKP